MMTAFQMLVSIRWILVGLVFACLIIHLVVAIRLIRSHHKYHTFSDMKARAGGGDRLAQIGVLNARVLIGVVVAFAVSRIAV